MTPGGQAEDSLQPFPKTTFDGDLSLGGIGSQDTVAVDFNGDGRPDPLFCRPDADGTLIHESTVAAGVLQARGKHLIEFPWAVPSSLSAVSVAIYADIDPDGSITEIHEDNNRGWNEIFIRRDP